MNDLKIVVGWQCNLNCDYCCNKQPEMLESFEPITVSEIAASSHDSYQVTGGEPLTKQNHKALFVTLHHIPKGKPIYLYTNGLLLDMHVAKCLKLFGVTAINLGVHDQPLGWGELLEVNKHIPIRVWVQDIDTYGQSKIPSEFEVHLWSMDDCYSSPARRVYLSEVGS